MNSLLVLPAFEAGRGGGHLSRSAALVKALRAEGGEAWLCAETPDSNQHSIPGELRLAKEDAVAKNWTLIVLDRFRTERDEVQRWAKLGPVLGIDEGLSRDDCDFLIDMLPGLPGWTAPNLCAPSLLPLPEKRKPSFAVKTDGPFNVLVSFGAEDAAGLTVDTALALRKAVKEDCILTVLLGPLRKNNPSDRKQLEQTGITVIEGTFSSAENSQSPVFELQEHLADYDLIVTHFGLTAFESLHARVPVLLINPGDYHEKLSRHAGFVSLGTGKSALVKLRCTADFSGMYRRSAGQSEKTAQRWGLEEIPCGLAELLLKAKPVVHRNCPLCGAPVGQKSHRFPGRTYRLCSCGTVSMDRLSPPRVEYNRDYFFSDYQKQYGKTYLEDFPQLQKAGKARLRRINALLDVQGNADTVRKKARLLDIGCAYGPFLAAAREQGFEVMGIDPVPDAVEYVKNTLGIDAEQGFFPTDSPRVMGQFDVITLWYVIEHFEEPEAVLMEINRLLKMGGILAFSTPSAAGVSSRKNFRSFLEQSPADHWTIWDPRRSAAVLGRYGFLLKKRVITGHHPERFPGLAGSEAPPAALRFCAALSRVFGLGDTFEAYALKVKDIPHA